MPEPTYPSVPTDHAVESLKTPPYSREAEQSVLGGLMLNNEAWISIADFLMETDFHLPSHQIIFRAIKSLFDEGYPCDPVTLSERLQKNEQLNMIGGGSYLGILASNTPSAANIIAYAEIVRERSILRQLVRVGTEIAEKAVNPKGQSTALLLDNAEKLVFDIAELGARGQKGFVKIDKVITETLSRIDHLSRLEGSITGLSSGFTDFDNLTSGLQRSDLIIIAGRPSMGKCVASDCQIVLSNGSLVTIEEIYQRKQAQLLTLKPNNQFIMTEPSDFIDDGIKPVFRVTTRLGRSIETTLTHPFLTGTGWQPLSKIAVGDKIAVPNKIAVFGRKTLTKCQIKRLAGLIGYGHMTGSQPCLTASHPRLSAVPCRFIPSVIFQLQPTLLAFFLNRLFAINGKAGVLESGQVGIGYCCVSEELIRQLQHILLRFGIIAGINKRVQPNCYRTTEWQLDITDAESIQRFIDKIGFFSTAKSNLKPVIHKTIPRVFPLRRLPKTVQITKKTFLNCCSFEQPSNKTNPNHIWLQFEEPSRTNRDNISPKVKLVTIGEPLVGIINLARVYSLIWSGFYLFFDQVLGGVSETGRKAFLRLVNGLGQLKHFLTKLGFWRSETERMVTALNIILDSPIENRIGSVTNPNCHSGQCNNELHSHQTNRLLKPRSEARATGEIYWDEIKTIEPVGLKKVYDLTIPNTHNFVANDICVHNTSFAMNLAQHVAIKEQIPVAVFSMEMSDEQLAMRLISSLARVNLQSVRTGKLKDDEWSKVTEAASQLDSALLFIDQTPALSPTDLRARVRRLAREHGQLGLVVIDYLQLMQVPESKETRANEVSEISRSLKSLAKELNVPVVALSQLNRSLEQRTDRRPKMSDLRESGSIEQDSDLIVFIYRDEVYNEDSPDKNTAEIIIAKQRNGPIGTVRLFFRGNITQFENYTPNDSYYGE